METLKQKLQFSELFFFCVFFFNDSSNQTAWRKANLACKLAIDNKEKDELLCGAANQNTRQRLVTSVAEMGQ